MSQPAGTIYDRGYRHYDGPREGRGRRVRAIALAGIRRALGLKRSWRAKVVPFLLLAVVSGPVAAFIGINVLVGEAAEELIGYADYVRLVATVLLVFAGTAAPELLCPDRRQHVLTLVLTRPVTRADYLAGKLAALLAVMALAALAPLLVLYLGNALTAPSAAAYLRGHLGDLGRVVAVGGILTAFYAVTGLAAASLTERRSVATAGYAGLFLGSTLLANLLFALGGQGGAPARRWLALASLQELPHRLADWAFGEPPLPGTLPAEAGFGGVAYLAAIAVVTALAGALLAWQVARVRP